MVDRWELRRHFRAFFLNLLTKNAQVGQDCLYSAVFIAWQRPWSGLFLHSPESPLVLFAIALYALKVTRLFISSPSDLSKRS